MVGELIAIAAAYGFGICLVHVMVGRGTGKAAHVVFLTNDADATIEWHLRSVAFMSRLEACDMTVTVLDAGSSDDTLRIVRRMARGMDESWQIVRVSSVAEAERWLEEEEQVHRVVRLPCSGEETMRAAT